MTTTITAEAYRAQYIADQLKTVRAFVRKANRWTLECQAHMADNTQPWNVRHMPSKTSKYRAYDAAARYASELGIERPSSFDALCALVGETNKHPKY